MARARTSRGGTENVGVARGLEGFHPATATWFSEALGAPTEVQAKAWPEIRTGASTLLLAPTGSGKTLAAFLAVLDRLVKTPQPNPKARLKILYVSPLKALAVDVERNLRAPLAGIRATAARLGHDVRGLEVAVRTGDTPADERAKMRRAPPDILITTPESLYLILTSQQREMLTQVDAVIVDEIHQMVASKRGAHLFLSLERLEALRAAAGATKPLQRIGLSATQRPLDEVARLLGGADVQPKKKPKARPVTIVDASAKKSLSITVEVPPPLVPGSEGAAIAEKAELEGLYDQPATQSVWPALHAQVVARIRAARSTMVFVNSRRLAERLATALNEVAGEELALAHHGSVAREKRKDIEERLKAGSLPCIVATSSLELGIDMGAVDQVIQVEAPPSVASGIQRIGRASHHVGGVPSGVLVPKHDHDLLACAAAAAGIEAGEVEETYYPRNPLDVLAQQIVAVVALGLGGKGQAETEVERMWDLVRSAAPFVDLPRASFEGVLDMLSGRYPSDEFRDLRPRITWDRVRGTLRPRTGAQRLAIMNGGTIPDRGLYGVFLQGSGEGEADVSRGSSKGKPSRRVGELDEEMVFELREGEVFLLGASSWRAEEITRDRVLVSPAPGQPGKMPFWHGDRAGRSLAFGLRIGALSRALAGSSPKEAKRLLEEKHHVDPRAADDLLDYVMEQREESAVPTDKTIVVERVPDELGDLRICVLTPFGSRVHAPWALAALRRLREERAGDIEAVWSDDGIVFRVPGGETPPDTSLLFPSAEEVEDMVTRELATSSMFAARFREAAARALLLPRTGVSKRTPLWAQRKRASDLLAVASQYPAFPMVLETYREVLRDAFDLPGLVDVLTAVRARKIKVETVDTEVPSRFAGSLLFGFAGNFIYDEDAPAAERRAQALTIDYGQLRELLGETELRKLLDPDVLEEHEASLQRRDRSLRGPDDLHDLLLWLGDVPVEEVAARAEQKDAAQPMIDTLLEERRAVAVKIGKADRLIAVEDAGRYRDALGVVLPRGLPQAFLEAQPDALLSLVLRHARTHAPFTARDVATRFAIGESTAATTLEMGVTRGKLSSGAFRPLPPGARGRGHAPTEYCDVEVLRALKQKTLARLRKAIEPVSVGAFGRFLVAWQNIVVEEAGADAGRRTPHPEDTLLRAIAQLQGAPIPASVLERHVLPARVPGYAPYHLDQLLAAGEVVWAGLEPIGPSDGRVALYLADQEALLARPPRERDENEDPLVGRVREALSRRGAVFFGDLTRILGAFPNDVLAALWDLVWAGEVTNDTFEPLRTLGKKDEKTGRRGRSPLRGARVGPRGSEGRWSLRRAVLPLEGDVVPTATEKRTATARMLLERYGVVLREAAAVEDLPNGFGYVYDVFKAMEDQGKVRRGYFVAGRGATQFALPGAEERLRTREGDARTVILAATDPANPYGAVIPWPVAEARSPQRAAGARVVLHDGELLAWLAKGATSIVSFLPTEEPARSHATTALVAAVVSLAKKFRKPLILSTIDGVPAPESPLAAPLAAAGFVARQGTLSHVGRSVEARGYR